MSQEDESTGQVNKAEVVICVALVSDDKSSEGKYLSIASFSAGEYEMEWKGGAWTVMACRAILRYQPGRP